MKRLLRFVVFLLLIAFGLVISFYFWNGSSASGTRLDKLSTWGLGHYLAKQYSGSRVLVLSNPFVAMPDVSREIVDQEAHRIEGLRKGFASAMASVEVVYPELRPGAAARPRDFLPEMETTTPLVFLLATNALERLLARHPSTDLIVSLIGVPGELIEPRGVVAASALRVAFLFPDLRLLGGKARLRQWFESGKVAGLVLNQPRAVDDNNGGQALTEDDFKRHYLLVQRDNLDEAMQAWGAWMSP